MVTVPAAVDHLQLDDDRYTCYIRYISMVLAVFSETTDITYSF